MCIKMHIILFHISSYADGPRSRCEYTYKTVIRSIMVYSYKAWTLNLKEVEKLLEAERKILQKILDRLKGKIEDS